MWVSFVVFAALASVPAQAEGLRLSDARTTFGPGGITRKDTDTLLPGDHVFISFDINGITVNGDGKVLYSTTTEVYDAANRQVFMQKPRDLETINGLGGTSVPGFAQLDVGLDTPPGKYTVRVTVTDRVTKKSASLAQSYTVLDKGFGIARVTTTHDDEGQVFGSVFQDGGSLWVNFAGLGFARGTNGQPHVKFEMRVLDDKGQPTLAKPFEGAINEKVPAEADLLPGQFLISLNRPGNFTVELKATDLVSNKTAKVTFPLTVLPHAP